MEQLGCEETLPIPVPDRGDQAFAEHVQATEVAIVFIIISDVMPMPVKLMPLKTILSPGIDPRIS
jgi:hypothetical protein